MKQIIIATVLILFAGFTVKAQDLNVQPTDFNGLWADGLKITVKGKSVSIDMSKQGRRNATGTVVDNKTIKVDFPGDNTYTGTLVSLNRINWGGGNNWDRDNPIFRPTDFNGLWAGGLKITVKGKSVSIDMSKMGRRTGTGTVVDNKTIKVNFPGDKVYTGTLVSLNKINWGGDNDWDRDLKMKGIQARLDAGETPLQLVKSGVKVDELYGKNYKGGQIFYIDVNDDIPGINGMVAAAEDQGSEIEWGCKGTNIKKLNDVQWNEGKPEGGGAELGDGSANTNTIIMGCATDAIAAKLCQEYRGGKNDDWFLPSFKELGLMLTNLHEKGHSKFAEGFYWSSSELDGDNAWFLNFTTRKEGRIVNKDWKLNIRAARAF